MGPPLDTPITDNVNVVPHGIHDLRQLVKWRTAAIQLSPTVIRYHYGICTYFNRFFGICHRHHAL